MRNPFREPIREEKRDIYVSTDVFAYLQSSGREDLCKDAFDCDKENVEPVLIQDLEHATTGEERNHIRGMIRAVSNFPPDHRSAAEVLRMISTDLRAQDETWQRVEDILSSTDVGEDIEDTVANIESQYNQLTHRLEVTHEEHLKETLKHEIEALRPIRDRLYLRRVHPEYASKFLS